MNDFTCSQKNPSNLGKWAANYHNRTESYTYGDTISYNKAVEFFTDIETVEDWGCGAGGFRQFWPRTYIGIDGSDSQFADIKTDLVTYRSNAEAVFMRHVLEHNVLWKDILTNAVMSFQRKFCLVLFTPFVEKTKEIAYYNRLDVPDIAFSIEDITNHFSTLNWKLESHDAPGSLYSIETIFYIEKQ